MPEDWSNVKDEAMQESTKDDERPSTVSPKLPQQPPRDKKFKRHGVEKKG